ncbi:hypothetical protein L195_g059231, partial [Trifolium pratense]
VADVDPLIEDLTRDKEVRPSVFVADVLNFEEEIFSSISVEAVPTRLVHVEVVHANDLAKNPRVDP